MVLERHWLAFSVQRGTIWKVLKTEIAWRTFIPKRSFVFFTENRLEQPLQVAPMVLQIGNVSKAAQNIEKYIVKCFGRIYRCVKD